MKTFDNRAEGRSWNLHEFSKRHDELPGRLEVLRCELCLSHARRPVLLGALLGHVGTAVSVKLRRLGVRKATLFLRESIFEGAVMDGTTAPHGEGSRRIECVAPGEEQALVALRALLLRRLSEAERGELDERCITEIADEATLAGRRSLRR